MQENCFVTDLPSFRLLIKLLMNWEQHKQRIQRCYGSYFHNEVAFYNYNFFLDFNVSDKPFPY